jgi:disease resistance protein RPM1
MAELAVLLAIKKIGYAVSAEAQRQMLSKLSSEMELITQLPSSMKRIQREFVVMQAFISNIDSYKCDSALQAWLQELRKIANEVEDVVDKDVFLLGERRLSGCGLFKKATSRPKNLLDWRSIALKFKELEYDLQHVTQIKDRWVRLEETHKSDAHITETELVVSCHGVTNDELVGIEENERKLMEMLQTEEKPGEMIVVWGQTGVGKTTLVSYVYNRVKLRYDLDAFVHVPYNDGTEELLMSLIDRFQKDDNRVL